jgi:hypothetical protein
MHAVNKIVSTQGFPKYTKVFIKKTVLNVLSLAEKLILLKNSYSRLTKQFSWLVVK